MLIFVHVHSQNRVVSHTATFCISECLHENHTVTACCSSRGCKTLKDKYFLPYCVIFPLYSHTNKLLCALLTCINLRNKKDDRGDNVGPSVCADYWVWIQKYFNIFKHLSEIAEHCEGTDLGFSLPLKKRKASSAPLLI